MTVSGPDEASFLWTFPNGSQLDTEQVEITAESVGVVELELDVTLVNGTEVELVYTIEIVESR